MIHLLWLGPRPLPEDQIRTWTEELPKTHPTWQVRLWRDKDILEFGLRNRKWFDEETDWGAKADIARYEILYRYGGLYVDADQIWLGTSLTDYVKLAEQKGVLCGRERDVLISIGVLFATPRHHVFANAIELIRHSAAFRDQAVWFRTGPLLFTQAIMGFRTPLSKNSVELANLLIPRASQFEFDQFVTVVPVDKLICNKWYDDWKLPRKNRTARQQEIAECRLKGTALTYDYGYTTNRLFEPEKK